MFSMFEYLARLIDQMDNAGITSDQVAIAITENQERKLLEEVRASCGVHGQTAHHAEYMGWRIIVKGKQ
jgi:hypothetical protein